MGARSSFASRACSGGLRTSEYLLHGTALTLRGAAIAFSLAAGAHLRGPPSCPARCSARSFTSRVGVSCDLRGGAGQIRPFVERRVAPYWIVDVRAQYDGAHMQLTSTNWLEFVRTLFANAADGVWVSGRRGEIRFWNRAAEDIMSFSAKQAVGQACGEVFCGHDSNGNGICASPCPIKALMHERGEVKHFDMLTRTRTMKPVWINVSCVRIPSDDGRVPTILHVFRDVTAAHQIDVLVRQQLAAEAGEGSSPPEAPTLSELSRRELEVLRLMRAGASTTTMAKQLFISAATVRNHVQSVLRKLKVHTRLEAVAYANRLASGRAAGIDKRK